MRLNRRRLQSRSNWLGRRDEHVHVVDSFTSLYSFTYNVYNIRIKQCLRKHGIRDRKKMKKAAWEVHDLRTGAVGLTDRLVTATDAQRARPLVSTAAWGRYTAGPSDGRVGWPCRRSATLRCDLEAPWAGRRRLAEGGGWSLLRRAPVRRPVSATVAATTTADRRRSELEGRRKRRRRPSGGQPRRLDHFTLWRHHKPHQLTPLLYRHNFTGHRVRLLLECDRSY